MDLSSIIYVSRHDGMPVETLDRILGISRANNVRDGITGALMIGDQHFLQILEGRRDAVSQCIMRIMKDDRHRGLQVIFAGDSSERLFLEWSMHRIETSRMKQQILLPYKVNGVFDPARMSQRAIQDLCRTLSADNWMVEAA